jgi:hypothetical protein
MVGAYGGGLGDLAMQGIGMAAGWQNGFDWDQFGSSILTGAYGGVANYAAMRAANKSCFAAGTPLRTPWGSVKIEDVRVGDLVLSRDENNPGGVVVAQEVEEVFVSEGLITHLHLPNGVVIRTTAEHPFFVAGRGWVACNQLRVGDLLLCEDGTWVPIEDLFDTGEYETVYNLRVKDFHTYFVGCDEWGFSVWAHNASREYYNVLTKSGVDREPAKAAAALIRAGDVEGGKAILRAALNNGKRKPDVIERKIDRALAQLDSLTRPSEWRAGFVEKVEARMPRTTDGKPMIHDLVDGKVVLRERQPGEYGEIGHIEGMEHRTLVRDNAGMTQSEFNNLLHSNPEWFRIETRRLAASHKGEAAPAAPVAPTAPTAPAPLMLGFNQQHLDLNMFLAHQRYLNRLHNENVAFK